MQWISLKKHNNTSTVCAQQSYSVLFSHFFNTTLFLECPTHCEKCTPIFDEEEIVIALECTECFDSYFLNSAGFCNRKHQQCQTPS